MKTEPELSDINFTLKTVSERSGVDYSTVQRLVGKYKRRKGKNGKLSAWYLLNFFDDLALEELKNRQKLQWKFLTPKNRPKEFYYALTSTVYHYRDYFMAIPKQKPSCKAAKMLLNEAAPIILRSIKIKYGTIDSQEKQQRIKRISNFCNRDLHLILMHWVKIYGCKQIYCEFYADLLYKATGEFVENGKIDVKDYLNCKPKILGEPAYVDKLAWKKMGEDFKKSI
ncbi:hypothetical protein [Enterocloster clostridioformis]|uniref:hypothetical protein n=1 Tax=Enterocloster clostridioformis TaxID=1531 RepID=UPI0011134F1E|nr:hypothetical protein [Enterocloster clostridioformis]